MLYKIGDLLHATSLLNGSIFEKCTLVICGEKDGGPWGFVSNQIHSRCLNELIEFQNAPNWKLFQGGPMATDQLFIIHTKPNLIHESEHLFNEYYLGGNLHHIIQLYHNNQILESDFRLFLGYCGWDAAQLEHEILEGSWEIQKLESSYYSET